jgi:acetolactate synthase-1/2/3 large subunit
LEEFHPFFLPNPISRNNPHLKEVTIMAKMTGSRAIAKTMERHDVEYFFHVSGGLTSLFVEIEEAGINLVLARSEKGAAYIADGYARIAYKPGLCYGQAGPGAINLAAGISEAYWTCTPLIALTGSTNLDHLYKFQYQELQEMPLFEPTTKWNAEIYGPERAGEIIRDAFMIATGGAPGPVHVNLHYAAANEKGETPETYGIKEYSRYPAKRFRPDPNDVIKTVKALAAAERPVIIAGGGAIISRAWDEVVRLAEVLMIPVATTLSGRGIIEDSHPLSLGVVGRYSKSIVNEIVGEADVVFYIGSRAGGMATDNWNYPNEDAKVLQLDIESENIGRNYHVETSLVCDAKLGIQDILTTIEVMDGKFITKKKYLERVALMKREWNELAASVMASDAVPIKPHRVIKVIREVLGEEDILVADTGQMGAWTGVLYPIVTPGRTYIRAAGTLGWSFPAAIGAKFAAKDRQVLNVTGDGGIAYHISELETALRCDTPFVAVVFNNVTLGMLHYGFAWRYGGKGLKSSDFIDVDYGKVARAFNCYGARIEKPGELRDAIIAALDSGKPAVVDVMIDRYELSPTTGYRAMPQGRQL